MDVGREGTVMTYIKKKTFYRLKAILGLNENDCINNQVWVRQINIIHFTVSFVRHKEHMSIGF